MKYYLYQKGNGKNMLKCYLYRKLLYIAVWRKLHDIVIAYLAIDESGETRRCYCAHKNGETPKNGIVCKTAAGKVWTDGYCASDETCTGPTSSDTCNEWILRNKKGDLCTPPSVLEQLISSIPWGK